MGKNAPLNMAAQSGYRGTFESVLTSCITVWYGNCSAADRKTLQRTVNIAAKIIGTPLSSILDIFIARCSSKANSIVKEPTHTSHSLFQLIPSGDGTGASEPAPPDCSTGFPPGCESTELSESVTAAAARSPGCYRNSQRSETRLGLCMCTG